VKEAARFRRIEKVSGDEIGGASLQTRGEALNSNGLKAMKMVQNLPPNRRQAVAGVAAGGAVLALGSAPGRAAAPMCVMTPQTTEGPFYVDPRMERSDIRDGLSGAPLEVRLNVVDAVADCRPLTRARVDIWHCDAQGRYSGFQGPRAERFLRGHQMVDGNGLARFTTLWPGWYPGRTPHIHFKVYLGEAGVLTGQLFLPDAVSGAIYERSAPYSRREGQALRNADDFIARQSGQATMAAVAAAGQGHVASLTLGVGKRT